MEAARLVFPIESQHQPGSYLLVFTDNGSGSVDFDTPVSMKHFVRPPGEGWEIHGQTAHGMGSRGGGWGHAGHGQGVHGISPRGRYQDVVQVICGLFYGPAAVKALRYFTFAAKIYDAQGRASASSPPQITIVINTWPRPPSNLAATSLSGGALSFSFTKSVDL